MLLLKKGFLFLTALSIIQCSLFADEDDPNDWLKHVTYDLSELGKDTYFVSLGSLCIPAGLALSNGLRKAAFPFDWLVSLDGEMMIELLEDNFLHFLDDDYLIYYGTDSKQVLNTYYHMEFVHESANYADNKKAFKDKFQRRVDRFRNLNEYSGKVYFMRSSYNVKEDPHRIWPFEDNLVISDEYAFRLYGALKKRFPKVDFSLIIINNYDLQKIEIEKNFSDRIIKINAPHNEPALMQAAYRDFFTALLTNKLPVMGN